MSRILRRPMFRGGRVDSRGTGITSGLDNRVEAKNGLFVRGADILAANQANTIPGLKLNPKSLYTLGSDEAFNQLLKAAAFDVERYKPVGKAGAISDTASLTDFYKSQTGSEPESFTNMMAYEDMDFGKDKNKVEKKETPTVLPGKGESPGEDDNDTTVNKTDLQDMIDRYEALLGGDKAKQRDIGDILGRASAAFLGAGDVREGLAEFMKAESQAGPSRTERIKQAAAMLGIKGEQAKELYETKLKNEKGMFTKKVEEIMRANDVDRKQATKMALGEPGTIGEAFVRYREKVGFPPSGIDFDALAEGYTSGPLPADYATSKPTGTFYIPGEMVIVEMVNGVQKSIRSYK